MDMLKSILGIKLGESKTAVLNGIAKTIEDGKMSIENIELLSSFTRVHFFTDFPYEIFDRMIRVAEDEGMSVYQRSAALALVFCTEKGNMYFEKMDPRLRAKLSFAWVYPMVRMSAETFPAIALSELLLATESLEGQGYDELIELIQDCREKLNEGYRCYREYANGIKDLDKLIQFVSRISGKSVEALRKEMSSGPDIQHGFEVYSDEMYLIRNVLGIDKPMQ
jgi:hypothetical protein